MKPNLSNRLTIWRGHRQAIHLARHIARHARPDPGRKPVVFFNATARLGGLSQNAAFALLAAWGLRLAGVPVVHFVCRAGMSPCILGTDRQDHHNPPPCKACIRQSRRLYAKADMRWFQFTPNPALASVTQPLSVEELINFEFFLTDSQPKIPLGRLVLPAARWALRRHTLADDGATRYLLRQYILSAYNVAQGFSRLLDRVRPSTVVIFNGIMYPEAAACWVAQQRDLRVITHEVGFQRFSAFFTEGEATAYPIHIPDDFELTPEQNARLDAYLEKRFQGQFSMAGIRFWPEMRGLDESFLQKAARFRQVVPVFTNVAYDTSQVHANQVFPHMFAWLDQTLEIIQNHPETLFVIRAHPDEMRPGTAKQSRETVHDWVVSHAADQLENVVFIDSQEYLSSYELIERAKFVMVYNSSIGMEAALLGKAVLCGGKARYTQYPIVTFPRTMQAYKAQAGAFLEAEEIAVPAEFQINARRFLYYQLYRASLSFEDYLEEGHRKGYVRFRPFSWHDLLPENSLAIRAILDGVSRERADSQAGSTFLLEEAP